MRWVHEGERPQSFCDIKAPGAKHLTRDLNPSDMITWEEGVQLSNWTYSLQFKAQILTQLDGGFRPSEFENLKFGIIQVEEDAIIVFVDGGRLSANLNYNASQIKEEASDLFQHELHK